MSIAGNYALIAENIERAAEGALRRAADIELLAVTKFVEPSRIREALDAGVKAVGENRVQELCEKLDFFNDSKVQIHMIGQLQTNKVKYVTGNVALIQSVDRESLASAISLAATRLGAVQDVLVEVNIGGEEHKGGVAADHLPGFLEVISALPGIRVKGLMCVPPQVGEAQARGYFAAMRRLFEAMAAEGLPNVSMQVLSMGMSGDYMAAIAEGATMVRIGTALFGARG